MALLRRAERAVRRLLRRPRTHFVSGTAGLGIDVGGRVSGRAHPPEGATLEENVAYLLRRDQDVQDMLDDVGSSLASMPARWSADIDEASEALRGQHTRALEQMRVRHLEARLLGVALLFIGIGLATAGNLV